MTAVPDAYLHSTQTLDPPEDWGPIWTLPLGTIAGARSGDKGGNANVGVWVRTDEAYHWLRHALDVDCFKALLPETAKLPVTAL